MDNSQVRKLLKDHGVADADTIPENKLRFFHAITRNVTNPDLLAKKIKDCRKTLYISKKESNDYKQ